MNFSVMVFFQAHYVITSTGFSVSNKKCLPLASQFTAQLSSHYFG